MRNSLTIGGVLGLVVLAVAAYFGSPFFAIHSLLSAARHGDKAKLDALVDFPSVREGLKSQMTHYMAERMTNDPAMQNNPFAGFGMALATTLVDKMVDAYVTPESISTLAEGQKPSVTANSDNVSVPTSTPPASAEGPAPKVSYRYVTVDRMEATVPSAENPKEVIHFDFERRSLLTWKLIKIDISELLAEAAKEPVGQPGQQ